MAAENNGAGPGNFPNDYGVIDDGTGIVSPVVSWDSLTPFSSIITSGDIKISLHDNVAVLRERRIYLEANDEDSSAPSSNIETKAWAAHVSEIRAIDPTKVYLRVFWFYEPCDVPGGQKHHHAANELIASDSMSIIDASSVVGLANVEVWYEEEDEEPDFDADYICRQYFHVASNSLSILKTHCICLEYSNPDDSLVHCPNPECGCRMHRLCIEEDVLTRLHEKAALDADAAEEAISNRTAIGQDEYRQKRRGMDGHAFEADLIFLDGNVMVQGHPALKIKDLRGQVPLVWIEGIICLSCHQPID